MFLNKADFISPKITLYFQGSKRHRSKVSGIITIISCLSTLVISFLFLSQVLFKTDPSAFFFHKYINSTIEFDIGPGGIFHFITVGNKQSINTSDLKIIGIRSNDRDLFFNGGQNLSFDHWEYSNCEEYHQNFEASEMEIHDNYFKKYLNYSLCISRFYNHSTKAFTYVNEKNFSYPKISTNPYVKNLSHYALFLVNENFDWRNFSDFSYYTIHFIDHYIEVDNYKSPFVSFYYNITTIFSQTTFTVNHLNYNPLFLKTRDYYFVNKAKEATKYLFQQNEKTTYQKNEYNQKVFGGFYFWMLRRGQVYERTYKKIQEALSNIGGLSKVIVTVAYLINKFYNNYIIVTDLNNFFEVDDKEKVLQKRGSVISLSHQNNKLPPIFLVKNAKTTKEVQKEEAKKKRPSIKFSRFFLSKIRVIYHKNVFLIEEYRRRVLSEEKLFKMYVVLKLLKKIMSKSSEGVKTLKKVNKVKNSSIIGGSIVGGGGNVNSSTSAINLDKSILKIK